MAMLLSGESGHHAHAPLSTGQTLSIFQVLERKIRELQDQVFDLRRDSAQTDESVAQLRAQIGNTNTSLSSVKESHTSLAAAVDIVRKDTGKVGVKTKQLSSDLDSAVEEGRGTRDALKVTDTNVATLKQELAALTDRVNSVQFHVEKKITTDVGELRDALKQTNATINTLKEDSKNSQLAQMETREALRRTDQAVQGLVESVAQINTTNSTLDSRVQETSASLRKTREHLAETEKTALKVQEDHKHTRDMARSVQEAAKTNASTIVQDREQLEGVTILLRNTGDQVAKCFSAVSQTREHLDRVASQVISLGEASRMCRDATISLRSDLSETQMTLHGVKIGLKETNSMVLPNLRMDIGMQRPGSAKGGGAAGGGSTELPSPGNSRRGSHAGKSKKVAPASAANPAAAWDLDADPHVTG